MNEKTISGLNQKMWYRFIKVIFIITFISFCGVCVWINFEQIYKYHTDYIVNCNYGNKNVFLALKDKQIFILGPFTHNGSSIPIEYGLPDDTKKELQSACGISQEDALAIGKISIQTNDVKKLYDLTSTKVANSNYQIAIIQSFLCILIIFIIYEIIKRLFYYIVLGSLRPKKTS